MPNRLVHDRYRLLERHGVGGMATLWRARDERTGEIVALKLLHPHLVTDPVARERLNREAAALRALDHPAIVQPREVIDDPDTPALVMDFAPGRSLATRLAEDGTLEPDEASAIVGTVADALGVAHRAGIVHRDVKPANILVEATGVVHLVDFGIANLAADADVSLTASRTVVGSLRYLAPERLAGAAATPQSDVWALGCVFREMLTGQPHEPGEGVQLPPSIDAIIRRATASNPADRFTDGGAFRDALDTIDQVDPDRETAVVPVLSRSVPLSGMRYTTRRARPWWSPVDRAASVFFAGVAVVMLVAMVSLGSGVAGSSAPPPALSPAPRVAPTPEVQDIVATPLPEDAQPGKGRGNGGGNGKGKGKDD